MKTKIQRLVPSLIFCLLSVMLLSFKPAGRNGNPELMNARKALKAEGNFQSIRIDGKVMVVLTNEPAGTVEIEGKHGDLRRVRHSLKGNTLSIDVNRQLSLSKVTIYLSALSLQDIEVNGDSDISSVDFIKSDNLHISLNGNISVRVKTLGKIRVDSPEEIEVQWKSPSKG